MNTYDHDLEIERRHHPENFAPLPTEPPEEENYIDYAMALQGFRKQDDGKYMLTETALRLAIMAAYSQGKHDGFVEAIK